MSALTAIPETVYDPAWYPDSGATNYITPESVILFSQCTINGDRRVKMANRETTHIHHTGKSFFFPPKSVKPLFLHNLLHVPRVSKNLLSVSQFACDNKVYFEFHADHCFVKSQDTRQILLEGKLRNGLYAFDDVHLTNSPFSSSITCSGHMPFSECNTYSSCNNVAIDDVYKLWHARLGHTNSKAVCNVLKLCKILVDCNKIPSLSKACCMVKSHKFPFPYSITAYDHLLQMI